MQGAAIATIISQVVSAALTLFTLMQSGTVYQVHLPSIKIEMEMLSGIIRIGLPAGLQSVMYSISNILIQASVNGFGTDVVAAWTAYSKIDSIFWMTLASFGIAITTFVGQNFGAGEYARVKKGYCCLSKNVFWGNCGVVGCFIFLWKMGMLSIYQRPSCIGIWRANFEVSCPLGMLAIFSLKFCLVPFVVLEKWLCPTIICCLGVCAMRVLWLWTAVPLFSKTGNGNGKLSYYME